MRETTGQADPERRLLQRLHVAETITRPQIETRLMADQTMDIDDRLLSTLAGAGSLLSELRLLMERPLEVTPPAEIQRWIVEENILAKRTQSGRVKVAKKLRERYLLDPGRAVFSDFCNAWRATDDDSQRALLAYLLFGARDGFFRTSACRWLSPRLRQPGTPLTPPADFERFIGVVAAEHPGVASWGNTTRLRASQHFLTAARDFGLATGKVNKVSVRPAVGPVVTWYSARLSILQKLPPRDALTSDWFVMLGFDMAEAVHALYGMAASGLGRFRIEGQVVELDLTPLG